MIRGDVLWLDSKEYALSRLAGAFDPARIDAVLLFQRTVTAVGYEGSGDYFLDPSGVPRRRGEREVAPYLFAGIQLLHRRLFARIEDRIFSLNRLFDQADTNKDGVVTKEELMALAAKLDAESARGGGGPGGRGSTGGRRPLIISTKGAMLSRRI